MPKKRKYTKRSAGKRAKSKGRGFENDIAKLLTKWSGHKFQRVPLSGGWDKKIVSGDVFCAAEYKRNSGQNVKVPLSIECKNQEGWTISQLFQISEKCPLRLWWDQSVNDSKKIKKLPALVFTRNYQPVFIMISTVTANRLSRLAHTSWKEFAHIVCPMTQKDKVVVLCLDDFLSWISFDTLLKLTV